MCLTLCVNHGLRGKLRASRYIHHQISLRLDPLFDSMLLPLARPRHYSWLTALRLACGWYFAKDPSFPHIRSVKFNVNLMASLWQVAVKKTDLSLFECLVYLQKENLWNLTNFLQRFTHFELIRSCQRSIHVGSGLNKIYTLSLSTAIILLVVYLLILSDILRKCWKMSHLTIIFSW